MFCCVCEVVVVGEMAGGLAGRGAAAEEDDEEEEAELMPEEVGGAD